MSIDKKVLTQLEIEKLICEMAEGKTEKMEELYESTSTAIFGYALSMLKNRSDAEDVVHDCYLQVYKSCKNYNKQGKPLAWMITITRNLCLEKLRKDAIIIFVKTIKGKMKVVVIFLGINQSQEKSL